MAGTGIEFLLPLLTASIVYVGIGEKRGVAELLLSGVNVFYRRFKVALLLVLFQLAVYALGILLAFTLVLDGYAWKSVIAFFGWSLATKFAIAVSAVSFLSSLNAAAKPHELAK